MGSDWKTPCLVCRNSQGGREGYGNRVTYNLVSTKGSMVRNLSLNILAPDDGMLLGGCKEFCNIPSSGLNGVESLLLEHTREVLLNSGDGSGCKVVPKDPKCRVGLVVLVLERILGPKHLLDGEQHRYAGYVQERWDRLLDTLPGGKEHPGSPKVTQSWQPA